MWFISYVIYNKNIQIFLSGSSSYNEVSIEENKEENIISPICVNDLLIEKTKGKETKNMYVGDQCTFIIVDSNENVHKSNTQRLKQLENATSNSYEIDEKAKEEKYDKEREQKSEYVSNVFL